jgi:hypothetical protein
MALKLTPGQVQIVVEALEMADSQLRELADKTREAGIRRAFKDAAVEYAQLGQAIKDGALDVAGEPSSRVA